MIKLEDAEDPEYSSYNSEYFPICFRESLTEKCFSVPNFKRLVLIQLDGDRIRKMAQNCELGKTGIRTFCWRVSSISSKFTILAISGNFW
jgi:hypothetical protein